MFFWARCLERFTDRVTNSFVAGDSVSSRDPSKPTSPSAARPATATVSAFSTDAVSRAPKKPLSAAPAKSGIAVKAISATRSLAPLRCQRFLCPRRDTTLHSQTRLTDLLHSNRVPDQFQPGFHALTRACALTISGHSGSFWGNDDRRQSVGCQSRAAIQTDRNPIQHWVFADLAHHHCVLLRPAQAGGKRHAGGKSLAPLLGQAGKHGCVE